MSDELQNEDAAGSPERTSVASEETIGSERPEGREAESEGETVASSESATPKLLEFKKDVEKAFGKDIIQSEINYGDLVVRLTKDGYKKAALICKEELNLDFLSFIAGIDWMPMPLESEEGSGDTSQPAQPSEMTFGVSGSAGRFQVFAHVQSTKNHTGLTIKVDVEENDMAVASWTDVYPGADWHERECWEMYGIDFVGHPEIRHLYLPGEFEGYPLRKDYPLLARVVKPWPGLTDVEPMPGEDGGGDSDE